MKGNIKVNIKGYRKSKLLHYNTEILKGNSVLCKCYITMNYQKYKYIICNKKII